MGLGRLLTRSTVYTATDTVTGATATYTVVDNLSPDFPTWGTYRGAMAVPGAWRASLFIAGLLGRLPWDAWRQIGSAPEVKLEPRPPLLEQPNPPETRLSSFRSMGLDYLYHGNGIAIVAARSQGWPTAMVPVSAMSVSVRRVPRFDPSPLPPGSIEYKIGDMVLGPQDVIHFKGPCEPGALRGMGVLENHIATIGLAQEQARQSKSVSNHGVPTGVLKSDNPDLTDDEALDMKAQWLANQRDRSIQVVNASTTFTPLSWNPEQLQLIEARKFTLNEIEHIFGLPVGWLGGTDSSRKYSNMSQDDLALMKWTMGDHIEQFEQTLTLAFPRGTRARANQDAVLEPDTLTRYQAHSLALAGQPWLQVDEVREDYEHRGPMPKQQTPDAFNNPGAGNPPIGGRP